jgi:hypothetical protein
MTASREYLVKHGAAGHLGRFCCAADTALVRGTTVVVRGRRSLELGEVMLAVRNGNTVADEFVGDLLRPATSEDFAAAARNRVFGQRLLDDAVRHAEQSSAPVAFVDIEVALDGVSAVLHGLRTASGDLDSLLAEVGESHSTILRLYEVNGVVEEDDHGCGSCGSGGSGGCGTCGAGGCSSCSSGASKDLEAYFAELREQMNQRNRVALL